MRTTLILAIVAVLSLGSFQALANGLFTGDNSCSLCHTDFTAGGSAHTDHTGFTSCSTCHVNGVGVDPVGVNTCLTCHDAPDIFSLHGPLQYGDPVRQCGYCHDGVANEDRTWSSLKNIFE